MALVSRESTMRTHNRFFEILSSIGGVMTFYQATKMLQTLDNKHFSEESYFPTRYLCEEIKAMRYTIDHERKLIGIGNKNMFNYDRSTLLGISCMLDIIDNADDLYSITLKTGNIKTSNFVYSGTRYKMIYVTHSTTNDIVQVIMETEQELSRLEIKAEICRPIYMILITEEKEEYINLTMERIEKLDIGYKHTIIMLNESSKNDIPKFEYFTSQKK